MDFNRESLQNSIRDEKTRLAVHIHHQNLRLDMNRNSRFFSFFINFLRQSRFKSIGCGKNDPKIDGFYSADASKMDPKMIQN